MKRTVTQVLILCVVLGLSSQAAWAVPAVFTTKVVEINGSSAGLPSTNVTVNPGDIVKIEAFLDSWAPSQLGGYQFALDVASMASGGGSPLVLTEVPCASDADCPVVGSCDSGAGVCECLESIFIDDSRVDFVFENDPILGAANCFTEQLAAGAILFTGSSSADDGATDYLGTVVLTVPDDACDVYTLLLDPADVATFVRDTIGKPFPSIVSGSITMSVNAACPTGCEVIGSAFPPDCEVDARQPHPFNDANTPQGFDSFEITFADQCDPSSLGVSDFSAEEVPFDLFNLPQVVGVTVLGADTVRVTLNRPIRPSRWTCVKLSADATQKTCVGFLPADVNADLTSGPADILAVIDSLNGVIPRPDFATDVDRSGVSGPPDILGVIDMLNGAAAFDPWINATLDACP